MTKGIRVLLIASGLALGLASQSFGACCAWSDRNACASCPPGYISGCRTEGNACECSCSDTSGGLIKIFSQGNQEIETELFGSAGKIQELSADDRAYVLETGAILTFDDSFGHDMDLETGAGIQQMNLEYQQLMRDDPSASGDDLPAAEEGAERDTHTGNVQNKSSDG